MRLKGPYQRVIWHYSLIGYVRTSEPWSAVFEYPTLGNLRDYLREACSDGKIRQEPKVNHLLIESCHPAASATLGPDGSVEHSLADL